MFLDIFIPILLLVLGTILGSFFTSYQYRYINNIKYNDNPNSFCDSCHHKLNPIDLVPFFSYIFLRGRCRYCHNKINPKIFLGETLSGLYFLLSYIYFRYLYPLIYNLEFSYLSLIIIFITYFLIIGSFIDLKIKELPYLIMILVGILSILYYIIKCIILKDYLLNNLLGLFIPLILFSLIYIIYYFGFKKEVIGIADIIIFSLLGLNINIFNFIALLFFTSFIALIFILINKIKKKELKEIPFIPFITSAYFIVSFFLMPIIDKFI